MAAFNRTGASRHRRRLPGNQRVEDTTTLGRGGSDTTAVALAAALNADVCEIYTDVVTCSRSTSSPPPSASRVPLQRETWSWPPRRQILHLRAVSTPAASVCPCVRSSFSDRRGPGSTTAGERLRALGRGLNSTTSSPPTLTAPTGAGSAASATATEDAAARKNCKSARPRASTPPVDDGPSTSVVDTAHHQRHRHAVSPPRRPPGRTTWKPRRLGRPTAAGTDHARGRARRQRRRHITSRRVAGTDANIDAIGTSRRGPATNISLTC